MAININRFSPCQHNVIHLCIKTRAILSHSKTILDIVNNRQRRRQTCLPSKLTCLKMAAITWSKNRQTAYKPTEVIRLRNRQHREWKSECSTAVQSNHRTLSCCEHCPLRLRGMFISILARTRVILEVTRQTLASPSCITMAPRSACCVGSHASSTVSSFNLSLRYILFPSHLAM